MKIIGLITIIFVCISFLGGYVGYHYLISPATQNTVETQIFVVKKGENLSSIADTLFQKGLIKSPLSLKLAFYLSKNKAIAQAGSFKLSANMSPSEIMENLRYGKLDIWITILEGWRKEETAESLAKTYQENGYQFDKSQFLFITKDKEGYLFPDTYLIPLAANATTVADILNSTFNKKITLKLKSDLDHSKQSLHNIVIMASLLEREARTYESRQIVSGILWKRLAANWPLQVDATLQYAKGYDQTEKTWWKPPLAVDKKIDSLYNTYLYPGLPKGPICSPSLSSVEAAIKPVETSYWYYLTDNNGIMHYATTLEKHQQNIANYL